MNDRAKLSASEPTSEHIEPETLVELATAATETREAAIVPKLSRGQRLPLARVKQFPKAMGRWIYARPWLALPLLAVFPVAAWHLDRTRPVMPVAIEPSRQSPTTIGNLMQPAPLGQITVGSPAIGQPLPNPAVSPMPTAASSLKPVDLNTLTPEQKAMNAKAKAALMGATALVDAQIEMQVGIVMKARAIAVGGASAVEVTDKDGKVLYQLAANEIYTAQPSGQGVTIGDQMLPNNVFLNAPQTGVIIVGGRAYRGRLRIVNDSGVLYGVSHVNMRNYLQSVVASEVSPTWGKEALKAQAVAARSYALTYYFKPASKHFHLGNDEYYQVYSGIEREAAETNQAVDETSGEYVSYKGGIVESLYAASDDIVAEAFAGKGMSQLGAKSLANQGYKYDQILAGYYPKTSVGKILPDL